MARNQEDNDVQQGQGGGAPEHVRFARRSIRLPGNTIARMALGVALIIGGVLGFLPVLGVWMIPLGIIVLSVDLPVLRPLHARIESLALKGLGWFNRFRRRFRRETDG